MDPVFANQLAAKTPKSRFLVVQANAMHTDALAALMREHEVTVTCNACVCQTNYSVLEACLRAGSHYIDMAADIFSAPGVKKPGKNSFEAEIEKFKQEIAGGRNPRDIKVLLAQEIVERFHTRQAAEEALADFDHRARGGIPDEIPEVTLSGAPMGIGQLLKQANLCPSSSEALRMVEQGGVRIDGVTISDKGLKVDAGSFVLQVGKRKFARVTLS
jgi:ribosome-associated protein YbcJ (S4-like RNA binding protein)